MRRLAVGLVVLIAVLGLVSPAQAVEAGGARSMAAGDTDGVHGSCRTYSTSAGTYGAVCSGGATARDYRALLGGAPVPTCWLMPLDSTGPTLPDATPFGTVTSGPTLTPDPTASPAPTGTPVEPSTSGPTTAPVPPPVLEPTPGSPSTTTGSPEPTGTETVPVELPEDFRKVCLGPAPDPTTLAPARYTHFPSAIVPVLRSSPDRLRFWWELTEGQRKYLTIVEKKGRIHGGTLTTSPSRTPRIGQVVAFSAEASYDVPLSYGLLRMRAEFVSLTVTPGEPGRSPVTCSGSGTALLPGATERTGPHLCSFTYEETSGGRGTTTPDTFDVVASETWRIEVSSDAGRTWDLERIVELPAQLDLRVTEVQTLVVPLAP